MSCFDNIEEANQPEEERSMGEGEGSQHSEIVSQVPEAGAGCSGLKRQDTVRARADICEEDDE